MMSIVPRIGLCTVFTSPDLFEGRHSPPCADDVSGWGRGPRRTALSDFTPTASPAYYVPPSP
jgi:hypothetical protein